LHSFSPDEIYQYMLVLSPNHKNVHTQITRPANLFWTYPMNDEDGTTNSHEFKETALAAYEQAIQLTPHEAILHYYKGQLLEQLGRGTEAVTAFEEADRPGYQRPSEVVDGRGGGQPKAYSVLIDAEQSYS
jgi:tetratricopeptide (TPR) repeat protein